MQIELRTEGGIAHFPGLSRPVTLDTEKLPEQDRNQVENLVAAARFFDLPSTLSQPRAGAADYRKHTVTVTDGSQQHTVQAIDPVESPEFRDLIEYLKTKRE
jgi:hypothetical protein